MFTNRKERDAELARVKAVVADAISNGRDLAEAEQLDVQNAISKAQAFDAKAADLNANSPLARLAAVAPVEDSDSDGNQYLDLGFKSHSQSLVKAMQDMRPMVQQLVARGWDAHLRAGAVHVT